MPRIKYLVVAEINRKGFMIGWRNSLAAADLLKSKTYQLGNKYSWSDLEKVEGELDYFDSYEIKGNCHWADRMETVESDGKFTVQTFRIPDFDNFHVDQFKREREYISEVFPYQVFEEKLFRVYELIECPSFVAN